MMIRPVLVLAVCTAAWAQGKLDASTMKAFGGTYRVDCADSTSAKATVLAEALVFLDGDKRLAGAWPQSAASFHGPNQPPEFRTVLLSDAPGGQLLFAIYQDKSGTFLKLDGDAKVLAAIGTALADQEFRRCDGAADLAPKGGA